MGWTHTGTTIIASFLASLVECVEALTVILAVGSVRGWRAALGGAGAALAVLAVLVLVLGRSLAQVPLHALQIIVGILLLLFGLRWLRKAVLRAAGVIPLHDEAAAFHRSVSALQASQVPGRGWDKLAFGAAFNITMLEGTEVVFIVIAIGAGVPAALVNASWGAVAALLLVVALAVALHRPLARVPENTLKLAVGVLLSAFGTFWTGEGLGLAWPAEDWSLAGLVGVFLAVAVLLAVVCRRQRAARLVQVAS